MDTFNNGSGADESDVVSSLLLRRVTSGALGRTAAALLGVLDWPLDADGSTLADTDLFALSDVAAEPEDVPAAAALVVACGSQAMELRRAQARSDLPRDPVMERLLADVADSLRARGTRRLVVKLDHDGADDVSIFRRAGFHSQGADDSNGTEVLELVL